MQIVQHSLEFNRPQEVPGLPLNSIDNARICQLLTAQGVDDLIQKAVINAIATLQDPQPETVCTFLD